MMAEGTQVGKGYIEIRADGANLKKDLGGIQSDVLGAIKSFGPAIIAAIGVGGIGTAIKQAINFGDELNVLRQRTGITVENLSRLKYVADQSGGSLGTIAQGVKFLSRTMAEKGMGGMDVNEALLSVADQFKAMPDGAEKSALAMKLFGRSGTEMIPILNQGAASIRAMMKEADLFGVTISGQFAQQADDFNDNLDKMGKMFQGIAITAAEQLVPALNTLMGQFVELWKQVGPSFLDNVRLGFIGVANGIKLVSGEARDGVGSVHLLGQLLGTIPVAIVAVFETAYMTIAGIFESIVGYLGSIVGPLGIRNLNLDQLMLAFDKRRRSAADSLLETRMLFDRIWESKPGSPLNLFDENVGKLKLNTDLLTDSTKALNVEYHELYMAWVNMVSLTTGAAGIGGIGSALSMATAGAQIIPDISDLIGLGGGANRDFAGVAGMGAPTESYAGPGAANDMSQYMQLLFGLPSLGQIMQGWMDTINQVDTMPLKEKLLQFGQEFQLWGMSIGDIAAQASSAFASFFSDAATQGIGAAGKKLLAAVIGIISKILISIGTEFMTLGILEILASLSPFTAMATGATAGHGALMLAAGAGLAAGGGLLSGLSSAVGGTAGGAGSSFQQGISRPIAPEAVNYNTSGGAAASGNTTNKGGSTTVIYAMDAKSFKEFADDHRDVIADSVLSAWQTGHPIRQEAY